MFEKRGAVSSLVSSFMSNAWVCFRSLIWWNWRQWMESSTCTLWRDTHVSARFPFFHKHTKFGHIPHAITVHRCGPNENSPNNFSNARILVSFQWARFCRRWVSYGRSGRNRGSTGRPFYGVPMRQLYRIQTLYHRDIQRQVLCSGTTVLTASSHSLGSTTKSHGGVSSKKTKHEFQVFRVI